MKGLPHMPSKAEQPRTPEPEEQIAQRSLLWGAVALLALLVLLTSLMSQQPDSSSGIKGVRLNASAARTGRLRAGRALRSGGNSGPGGALPTRDTLST